MQTTTETRCEHGYWPEEWCHDCYLDGRYVFEHVTWTDELIDAELDRLRKEEV